MRYRYRHSVETQVPIWSEEQQKYLYKVVEKTGFKKRKSGEISSDTEVKVRKIILARYLVRRLKLYD
jgi:hypothetical protein